MSTLQPVLAICALTCGELSAPGPMTVFPDSDEPSQQVDALKQSPASEAAETTECLSRAEALSSKGEAGRSSLQKHADQDDARENAGVQLSDAGWHARSAAAVGWQPPPPAQSLGHAPPDQAKQSSLAAGLGVHAQRSAQQPSLFRACSDGANSSPACNTIEQDLGSQDDQAAELAAQAAAAAGRAGTKVKDVPSGGLTFCCILAQILVGLRWLSVCS